MHHLIPNRKMMGWLRRLALTTSFVLGTGLLLLARAPSAQAESSGRPWLGVELAPKGSANGARVLHVVRGSPAYTAGIRENDLVVELAHEAVRRADDLTHAVATHAPGEKVEVSLVRDGAAMRLTALLVPMPSRDEMLRLDHIGAPAPGWRPSLAAASGDVPSDLGQLRGKVVVLDFWATWCTACRMAASRLSTWQAKFGAQGLSVIGITDDSVSDALEGASTFGMRYAIASDESYATQRAFGVRALPTVFVIDKRGIVRDVSVGYDPRREAEVEALLQRLLAEP